MSFLKHFSIFVLIIICFSSFMLAGGGEGVRRGGARKEVLQVDLPCASQRSFLNINRYFLFFFQVKVVNKQNIQLKM